MRGSIGGVRDFIDKKIRDFVDEKIVVCEILFLKEIYLLIIEKSNEKEGNERDNNFEGMKVFSHTEYVW